MQRLLGSELSVAVVASNRPQALALARGHALVQPPRTASEYSQFIAQLQKATLDVIFCFSYSMILDATVLSLPKLGAINIHGGSLPKYRGANVLNWAIIEGAENTGVTAHYMTTGIDEGDIIYQEETPILESDTASTLKRRLDEIGFMLTARIHSELSSGNPLPRTPQDPRRARYFRRRTPEDGRIDWGMSDRQIFNLVRALVKPWPGAFFFDSAGNRIVLDRYLTMDEVRALRACHGR